MAPTSFRQPRTQGLALMHEQSSSTAAGVTEGSQLKEP
jgi:hypothetical protein